MLHMGWLRSLFSPLKKLWIRLHSARRKNPVVDRGGVAPPRRRRRIRPRRSRRGGKRRGGN
ncbi:hypothetical protein BHE74_00028566, partial [Ensete ventricosum]